MPTFTLLSRQLLKMTDMLHWTATVAATVSRGSSNEILFSGLASIMAGAWQSAALGKQGFILHRPTSPYSLRHVHGHVYTTVTVQMIRYFSLLIRWRSKPLGGSIVLKTSMWHTCDLIQVTVEMKSEAVSFPAVTLCNYRNLDFDVINSINEHFSMKPSGNH